MTRVTRNMSALSLLCVASAATAEVMPPLATLNPSATIAETMSATLLEEPGKAEEEIGVETVAPTAPPAAKPVAEKVDPDAASVDRDVAYLGEIVITAQRTPRRLSELPTNVSVITAKELADRKARTLAEALEGGLGITEISDRGTRGASRDIRIRSGGDAAKQVLVMIDGQAVNDVSLGTADLEMFPVGNVERIEVVRGPSSALWGVNALGGVVNVITKKAPAEGVSGSARISGGSFFSKDALATFGYGKGGNYFSITGRSERSKGWRENSRYEGTDMTANAGCDLGNLGELGFRVFYGENGFGLPGKNTTPIGDYNGYDERQSDSDATMDQVMRYGQVAYEKDLATGTTVRARIYGNWNEKRFQYPKGFSDDLSVNWSRGAELQFDTPNSLVVGVDVHRDNFVRKDMKASPVEVDTDKEFINESLFIQEDFNFGFVTVVLGARYDQHSLFGGQANPRASVTVSPLKAFRVTANVGRAFSAPTFEDLFSPYSSWPVTMWGPAGDSQGNEDLRPESAWGYDLGVEHSSGDSALERVTFFRNDVKDLIAWDEIDPDPAYDKWRPSNVGRAYNQGIELEVIQRIAPGLSQGISYTYLESKGKENPQDGYRTLMYSPPHRVGYRLDYESRHGTKVGALCNVTETVEWKDDYGMIHSLPAYTLVNCRFSQQVCAAEVFFAIDNALDTKYQSREHYPLPGRSYRGGVEARF